MTEQRLQLALNVDNLETAIAYYEKLFGVPVNKRKPGYANFAIDAPPLKLVLFENKDARERLNHLGVEVFDPADVAAAAARMEEGGILEQARGETTCCYAAQDKVWSRDPQGMPWEWYVLLEDSESFAAPTTATPAPAPSSSACGCC